MWSEPETVGGGVSTTKVSLARARRVVVVDAGALPGLVPARLRRGGVEVLRQSVSASTERTLRRASVMGAIG